MPEKEILEWLKLEKYRRLIETCETTAMPAKEISKLISESASETGDMLETLERHGAVKHGEGGWKATELAIRVLNKYFR